MPKLQQRPFSITIFIPDGDPDSLRLVEKSNWTGIGVVFNRTGGPAHRQWLSQAVASVCNSATGRAPLRPRRGAPRATSGTGDRGRGRGLVPRGDGRGHRGQRFGDERQSRAGGKSNHNHQPQSQRQIIAHAIDFSAGRVPRQERKQNGPQRHAEDSQGKLINSLSVREGRDGARQRGRALDTRDRRCRGGVRASRSGDPRVFSHAALHCRAA